MSTLTDPDTGPRPSTVVVPGRRAVRAGRFSGVLRVRTAVVLLVCAVALVLAAAVNMGRGDYPIAITDVLATLFGGGDAGQQLVVLELRLPRTLVGALVGGALAVSGAILQAVARNPLASPDIIGVQWAPAPRRCSSSCSAVARPGSAARSPRSASRSPP